MGINLKETLDLLKEYPSVKSVSVTVDHGLVRNIEFWPPQPQKVVVTENQLPLFTSMPSDDVMLFAATEDPEEAMKGEE